MKWCIVRILLLVPIYAIDAYFCLLFQPSKYDYAYLLNAIRELYEAVVLISFVQFVMAFLGDEERPGPVTLAKKLSVDRAEHISYLRKCLPPMAPGADFVAQSLFGILQYAFVMVFCLVVDVTLWYWRLIDRRPFSISLQSSFDTANVWLMGISNTVAMYFLVVFYHETLHCETTKKDMMRIQPYNKFFCIKGIVMLTFWQNLMVSALVNSGAMSGCVKDACKPGEWTKEEMGGGMLNFILCLEMMAFAEWHQFAYPASEFYGEVPPGCWNQLMHRVFPLKNSLPTFEDIALGLVRNPDQFLNWRDLFLQIRQLRFFARQQRGVISRFRPSNQCVEEVDIRAAFVALTLDENAKYVHAVQVRFFLVEAGWLGEADAESVVKIADQDKDGFLFFPEFEKLVWRYTCPQACAESPSLSKPLL